MGIRASPIATPAGPSIPTLRTLRCRWGVHGLEGGSGHKHRPSRGSGGRLGSPPGCPWPVRSVGAPPGLIIRPVTRIAFAALSTVAWSRLPRRAPSRTSRPCERAVLAEVQKRQLELLREYVELLALPNVASRRAGHPQERRPHRPDAGAPRGRGAPARRGGRAAAVYGELARPGAPRTVVFYAHYDGQPVDPADWTSRSLDAGAARRAARGRAAREVDLGRCRAPLDGEWRLYAPLGQRRQGARSSAMLAALDALRAAGAPPSVNLKFFFEGEEEAGSPHLAAMLRDAPRAARGRRLAPLRRAGAPDAAGCRSSSARAA